MQLTNDKYFISGIEINDLVKEYDTPLYVYDGAKISEQFRKMKDSLKVKNFKINYAAKALTNISILKLLKKLGSGIDAVSIQEIELALIAGFAPKDIVFTPNSVSFEEIESAIHKGVRINIDNIVMLEEIGHKYPQLPVGIRINPHIMAGGNSKISVGHIDSKFGISIHQIPLVERIIKTLNIKVNGIHMHTGSDILDVEVFLYAADILFNTAKHFQDIEYIDFGSGFKVKYKNDDIETNIEEFGAAISHKFNEFCQETGKEICLMFEPGKYLVSEAGYFLVKANVIKQTTSTVFVGVDSGFNHLIRPMFYNAHHEIINISNPNGNLRIYTVVGYICETDTFAWNRKLNEVRPNDILLFKNAGAYSFAMSSNYNSRYRPAEVLIHHGQAMLIRNRESLDDLLKNQIEVEII
jgi:diaminopimelate decarboxylase